MFFNVDQVGQFFFGEVCFVNDGVVGVGGCYYLCVKFYCFFNGVLCDVVGVGDCYVSVFEVEVVMFEYCFGEVDQVVISGFWMD